MDFFKAWLTMLLIGAAHATDARVPALGYWTTVCLVVAVGILTAATSRK